MSELEKFVCEKTLSALFLLAKDKVLGIKYINFVKQNNMDGVLELIDRGYAEKISTEEVMHYRLTSKGINYLDKIIKFASEEF